jgi:cytochrome c553
MKKILLSSLALATLAFSFNSFAGDIAAGKAKSGMCAGCHGTKGKAMIPTYPNLAGQNQQYLVSAIKSYKSKARNGGQAVVMQGMAGALSNEDIDNLAAYFSSLK